MGQLSHPVTLRREVVDARLSQHAGEMLVTARFDRVAHTGRGGAQGRTEQPRQRRVGGALRVGSNHGLRDMPERGSGDVRVGLHARCEAAGRRPTQTGDTSRAGADRAGSKERQQAHRVTAAAPNTRSSSSSRPSRPRRNMPTAVRHAATTSVANPPLER